MSSNTQEQGRSYYTERDFPFTPTEGEDVFRTNSRWEIELQRQLFIGDVTKDAAAKQAALDAPFIQNFVLEPGDVTGVAAVVGTVLNLVLNAVNTEGFTAALDTGTMPAGLSLTVAGSDIKLTGTPSAAGAIALTVKVTKEGFADATFSVAGTITAAV